MATREKSDLGSCVCVCACYKSLTALCEQGLETCEKDWGKRVFDSQICTQYPAKHCPRYSQQPCQVSGQPGSERGWIQLELQANSMLSLMNCPKQSCSHFLSPNFLNCKAE